jgi:hypothetical protein
LLTLFFFFSKFPPSLLEDLGGVGSRRESRTDSKVWCAPMSLGAILVGWLLIQVCMPLAINPNAPQACNSSPCSRVGSNGMDTYSGNSTIAAFPLVSTVSLGTSRIGLYFKLSDVYFGTAISYAVLNMTASTDSTSSCTLTVHAESSDDSLPLPMLLDSEDTSSVSMTGTWTKTTCASCLGSYYYTSSLPGSSFTFVTSIPKSGTYQVKLTYPSFANPASTVVARVYHSQGESSLAIDQTTGAESWALVGNFSFFQDEQAYVEFICISSTTATGIDAVEFVYLGYLNVSSRIATVSSATWTIHSFSSGEVFESADLTDVLQEVINRDRWIAGNAVMLLIEADDSCGSVYGTAPFTPVLSIRYIQTCTSGKHFDNEEAESKKLS